jgi:polyphosphate kinase 2 (PPK2 family)
MRANARVVVEGMDGSGKTTLVKKILAGLGPEISYLVRNDSGPNRDLKKFWYDSLSVNPKGLVAVHDRFFYPEVVYGPVLRGKLSVDGGTIEYVSEHLRHFALLIYCRPDIEVIKQGIEVESQWPGVKEHFFELIEQYDRVMVSEAEIYQDRFFKYDWKADEADLNLLEALEDYLG